MALKTITENGEYELPVTSKSYARTTGSSTVIIMENEDSAVCTFGLKDSSGNFKAFPGGAITEGDIINHGRGAVLMVKITGITSNSVQIQHMELF